MILKQEFYFIRHGATTYTSEQRLADADVSINEHGINQANNLIDFVSELPIKSICYSPLKRAKETKEIVTSKISLPELEVHQLKECSGATWNQMMQLEMNPSLDPSSELKAFFEQTAQGINLALMNSGPCLIIAHGGIHWALCYCLGITGDYKIDNCNPVHFFPSVEGMWNRRFILEQQDSIDRIF